MAKFILGNWKMYLTQEKARSLAGEIARITPSAGSRVAVFPPFTALTAVALVLQDSAIALGAQDCSPHQADGAYTGDVSAAMLKDAGCSYVILGHSERRQYHNENNQLIRRKVEAALQVGLKPVICVGESQQERVVGRHLDVILQQVRECLPALVHSDDYVIAYEPVWAIGSGAIPTLVEIEEVHKTIASLLTYATPATRTAIVYGGSVKASNARDILSADTVNGALVGGASLKSEEFAAIINAAV